MLRDYKHNFGNQSNDNIATRTCEQSLVCGESEQTILQESCIIEALSLVGCVVFSAVCSVGNAIHCRHVGWRHINLSAGLCVSVTMEFGVVSPLSYCNATSNISCCSLSPAFSWIHLMYTRCSLYKTVHVKHVPVKHVPTLCV